MPHSLKSKIKSLCYKGELSEKERDRIIKALEQTELNPSYNGVKTELEPCEDCISREAVKRILANQRDELIKLHTVNPEDNPKADAIAYGVNWSLNTLMELPSVTPKAESEDKE